MNIQIEIPNEPTENNKTHLITNYLSNNNYSSHDRSFENVPIDKFHLSNPLPEHPLSDDYHGLKFITDKTASRLLAKTVAQKSHNIATNKMNLTQIIPPAKCLSERTQLMVLADDSLIILNYIDTACKIDDPIERIQLIAAGFQANMYLTTAESKGRIDIPTFPGETLEGSLANGTRFVGHHVSSNPRTNRITITGANNSYIFETEAILEAKLTGAGNTLRGTRKGDTNLKLLSDGTTYKFNYPTLVVEGALTNKKSVYFQNNSETDIPYVKDVTNNLIAQFEYKEQKKIGNFWDNLFGSKRLMTCFEKNQVEIKISSTTEASGRPVHF